MTYFQQFVPTRIWYSLRMWRKYNIWTEHARRELAERDRWVDEMREAARSFQIEEAVVGEQS